MDAGAKADLDRKLASLSAPAPESAAEAPTIVSGSPLDRGRSGQVSSLRQVNTAWLIWQQNGARDFELRGIFGSESEATEALEQIAHANGDPEWMLSILDIQRVEVGVILPGSVWPSPN